MARVTGKTVIATGAGSGVCEAIRAYDASTGALSNMTSVPIGRVGLPDVAKVICFLASDGAGFVTGVSISADCGLSASNGQPDMAS